MFIKNDYLKKIILAKLFIRFRFIGNTSGHFYANIFFKD